MAEIRGDTSNLQGVRRKINKAAKAVRVAAPKKETAEEKLLIKDLNEDAGYRKTLDEALREHENSGSKIPNDHLKPIIFGPNSKDPRLREDISEPSPLTPAQVADYLSSRKDKKTGMPIIPRKPGLQPWEGTSHQ